MRSILGIICGLGIIYGWGSFAVLYRATPFPHELAQPSVLNGDKGKNVVTYSLPHKLAQPSVLNGNQVKNVESYSLPP